ncbi:hypothetical protein C4D60_Mb01t25370 [Musa balbisiana]|uniref:Serine/threonine-protein kinase PRP4 homolog n=1 Tax=Musa balbisiana TaxID=52838 RepID=A0A4S8JPR9_MUSBA|nr:hypothetical protein C4D60_Mb01t25370 [Musa balbisiana]
MASEELPSPTSSRKHRRSSDDHGAEASSKRRKHHHRRHRRRSRHGRESDDGIEVADPASDPEPASLAAIKAVDDEREEGEILEEDEERAGVDGGPAHGLKIMSDGVDASSDLTMPGVKVATSGKSYKVLIHNQNGLTDSKMLEPAPSCENSSYTDQAKLRGDISDGDTFIRKAENVSPSDVVKKTEIQGETRLCQLELSEQNEIKHKHTDRIDIKIRVRSRSPGERSPAAKHRKRDDPEDRDSGSVSERLDSKQYPESRDSSRRASDKIRSVSPKTLQDGYRDNRMSPSFSRQHDEGYHRSRSSSHDHTRRRSYEKVLEPSADGNDQVDSHGNMRGDSDRYCALDRYAAGSQAKDKIFLSERESSGNRNGDRHGSREHERNRERNSSIIRERDNVDSNERHHRERGSSNYSRYNRGEGRHGSRERDREKERNNSSYRDRDKVDLDKGVHKQREGSSDYSRYHRREVNDRARDEPSDIRDKFLQRERLRDGGHARDRDGDDRDKNRARHKDVYAHEGRNQGAQLETDKPSSRDRHRESRHSKYDGVEHHKGISRSKDDGSTKDNPKEDKRKLIREEEEEDYQEKIEQQLAKQDEEDIDKIKEESRRRRQAILEKHRQRHLQQVESSSDGNNNAAEKTSLDKETSHGFHATSADNKVISEELENVHHSGDVYDADLSFTVGKSPMQEGDLTTKKMNNVGGLGEGTPKSERSADMFSDDIFGESPVGVCKMGKGEGPQIDRSFLYDNWDDAEGYYSYRFGEVLDSRYEVIAAHGKGVFSTVVRAKDLKAGKGDPEEVAVKIIRNNDTMYKAGQDELVILKKLAGADPDDRRHCVRFLSSFKYRNHLCLVFESLHMNLREVLKKFGRNIGLKLTAVRAYAKQLFIALKHLRNCGVLHCDIKPDNMLVNEAKNVLKLCDFGNAMFAGKNEITPYLVSRFYRAPEIILGLPYDHPMDMWSVGCCLYELYTGKVLFPGPSNNDMLRLHMELKGTFPKKMLRKGAFTDQHFDQDLNFHATEEDPVTKKPVKRLLFSIKPKDIGVLISGFPGEDSKMLSNFKDLLDRIFVLDPEKRMTISQALSHPFITGK